MRSFPDDPSLGYLRDRNVEYVILRGQLYPPEEWAALVAQLRTSAGLSLVSLFADGDAVFALRR